MNRRQPARAASYQLTIRAEVGIPNRFFGFATVQAYLPFPNATSSTLSVSLSNPGVKAWP